MIPTLITAFYAQWNKAFKITPLTELHSHLPITV